MLLLVSKFSESSTSMTDFRFVRQNIFFESIFIFLTALVALLARQFQPQETCKPLLHRVMYRKPDLVTTISYTAWDIISIQYNERLIEKLIDLYMDVVLIIWLMWVLCSIVISNYLYVLRICGFIILHAVAHSIIRAERIQLWICMGPFIFLRVHVYVTLHHKTTNKSPDMDF